jgi:hypothetical protein
MTIKPSLFAVTAIAGLLSSLSFAGTPTNTLGYIDPGTSVTAVCSASRFFPGALPGNPISSGLPGGLQTDFIITNSDNRTLSISKIDVYAMNGRQIATYSKGATLPGNSDNPAFKWDLAGHETTVLSKEAVLPPNEISIPTVLWHTVVFTLKARNPTAKIFAPLVFSDYAEYKKPLDGGTIIDRIRASCVYR